ncbi:hypothetical protein N0V86_005938 [Didymella sp. IMI 355093]|nr:hypothetical protein N0V86_005938 [Didymella sp. IMI 355093]
MQFTLITLLVSAPLLALANPVDLGTSSNVGRSLERRGGKDFCGSDLRAAGDSCTFGSDESEPHACGIKDRAVVLECRNGKWEIDHRCPSGQMCQCDKGVPARGNLVCRG